MQLRAAKMYRADRHRQLSSLRRCLGVWRLARRESVSKAQAAEDFREMRLSWGAFRGWRRVSADPR